VTTQSRERIKEEIPKGFAKKQFTMELTFSNLGLKLNKTGKVVLRNVSGTIRNSRMTAVMGPSGSGKTTLDYDLFTRVTHPLK
jgi:ABC-type bacteriocin/lantibiotic exporter with double-glycine peptidase domain